MAEAVVVRQSDLQKGPASPEQQTELDRRNEEIVKGDRKDADLFDPEPEAKKPAKEPDKKPDKEPDKKPEEGEITDADLLETEDKDLDDTQKAKKEDLVKAKEVLEGEENDKRILETDEKDLKENEKARKGELVKEQEARKTDEDKVKEFDKEVKDYATEHKVSEEDARKDLESISKIVENSKGDAKTIAKNYHHLQRMKARTDEELKAFRNAPPPMAEVTSKSVEQAIEAGKITIKGKSATKEQLIEAYKGRYTDLTDGLEDETVFKMLTKEIKEGFDNERKGNVAKLSSAAKDKKAKLIGELSEDAKKYLTEMQPVIDRLSDAQIMSEQFSLEDMVLWSKGKAFDTSVKDADARGFKRGVEARRILGEIKKPGEGTTKTKKTGGKTTLTDAQQKKAEEMFATNDIPLARKYELYAEVAEHDEKLNKEKKEKDSKSK